ncbi:hypothetical protein LXM25_26145 [Dyadobacter sp. LJ53]|uniref:hypothetical protein n=1 Tax=Dyadobacter chenwenxiniae TaxID=2906456 RepID=UPI001F43AD2D|nr:hypothetical protein [Dyadobacter chenwenxiniae]MCF0053581.1 hypothetical protein [Dyadobacter chenwenxiniae]
MRRLLYVFAILFFISCDKDKNPDPAGENALDKQQAPFGKSEVEVELKKVLFNGILEAEYSYEGKMLAEELRFSSSSASVPSQRMVFKRAEGKIQTVEIMTKSQGDSLEPSYLVTYEQPINDSLRYVTRKDLRNTSVSTRIYAFDNKGYITRQEVWADLKATESTNVYYVRNEQNNVAKSWTKKPSEAKGNDVEYMYDNHPNPFFKMGLDSYGEITIRSLSPNNPVREIYYAGSKVTSNIYYTYDYLPNGYPSKVTVRVESVNFPPYSYNIEFGY